jgi:ATP-dependent RNA helicase HelY
VVGEFAVHLALRQDRKCFYTTPIKALSNQKYNDLVAVHGAAKVGLLTGDNAINGDAPVVVMTTEVLRNMLYAGSPALHGLSYVVMDEVHYLADRFRGAVWEEVIIHLPASVTLVSLSATVSNAEEFADWLVTVRGETEVVVSEHRPVPLWQHMLVGRRMFDLFHDQEAAEHHEVHPELLRYTRDQQRRLDWVDDRRGRSSRPPCGAVAVRDRRAAGSGRAAARDPVHLQPGGCSPPCSSASAAGIRLNGPDERAEVRAVVEERTRDIPAEDLQVLGYWEFLDGLERGLAAHHAGMLPTFKEIVEELFVRGPGQGRVRHRDAGAGHQHAGPCVVLERLVKFNGEQHVDLTPGSTPSSPGGPAGAASTSRGTRWWCGRRRSTPQHVAGLASTRTYPLRSSFRPSYNMAVNLVGNVGTAAARDLLESSFAQFQADRSVVGVARQVQRNVEAMASTSARWPATSATSSSTSTCASRSPTGNARWRGREPRSAGRAVESLERLRVGDVIQVPTGRRAASPWCWTRAPAGSASAPDGAHRGPLGRPDRRADFAAPVEPLARVRVPKHFNPRSPQSAPRPLAASLRNAAAAAGAPVGGLGGGAGGGSGGGRRGDRPKGRRDGPRARGGGRGGAADDPVLTDLRTALRRHPCHGCPDREEHARWAERRWRLHRETEGLRAKVAARTGSLARTFDRVCALLGRPRLPVPHGRGDGRGRTLARVWTEADLLVAECVRTGVWDGLAPAELAAAVSVVLYESRRDLLRPRR